MAHVLLFRPIYDPRQQWAPTFPWALLYLAAPLVERGIEVDVVDEPCMPDYQASVVKLLAEKRPVAVGVSSMTGEQIRYGLRFSRLVREHSDAAIVWGGIHPSLLPEQTVRHELVDYAVAGEGDAAFPELVQRLAAGKETTGIPGVFSMREGRVQGVRQDGFVDMASLPELPYHLIDVERYVQRRPELGCARLFEVCTSRGCPHHCGFCYVESVHSSCWRHLGAGVVVERIKDLVQRFELDGILFREDNFFVSRKRVEAIAQGLINEQVGIKWAGSCRVDYFANYSPEFIDLLKRSGCVLLTFGVESGSARVLELIRKEITIDVARETARKVCDSGIQGSYHFMAGLPSETEDEFLQTCRLMDDLLGMGRCVNVRDLAVFTPYPGLGLLPECRKLGYQEPESLEAWTGMDWTDPARPWLTPEQSRRIYNVQFVLPRLRHTNPLFRKWARVHWNQILEGKIGPTRLEHAAIATLRKVVRGTGI